MPHRLVLAVERDDHDHRPEDLLLRDPHVVGDAGEDRRLDEVAIRQLRVGGTAAAGDDGRALGAADLEVLHDPLGLAAVDQGAQLGRPASTGGRPGSAARARRSGRRTRRARCARPAPASRPSRPRPGPGRCRTRADHRPVEVGVGEHDRRRLAAQLERDPLDGAGAGAHHRAAGDGRSGEGDLVDAGVLGQRGAGHLAQAGHHVEDARAACPPPGRSGPARDRSAAPARAP